MDDEGSIADNNVSDLEQLEKNNDTNTNHGSDTNQNELITKITEEIHKKYMLTKKSQSLQQKLAMFISGTLEKDNLLELDFFEDVDEGDFRMLLDSIAAQEDQLRQASKKNSTDVESLKEEIRQKRETLEELKASFKEGIEKTALLSVNSETGEHFSTKEVRELLAREEEVSKILEEYQLHSIQKRHHLNLALEKKKNLAEGPIDFAEYEMMCIETQNNKEIIQPLSEEIKTITKKASNMMNILSHLSQKLYLAQKEKTKASNAEKELENELNEMRDMLFGERMKYNKMKRDSKELQHKFILLQYPRLIEDYNEICKKNEEARKELKHLKDAYEEEMKIMNKKVKQL